ncbi:efflux RND transporter periplasmic adaptor subunit [Colwellia sp. MB3u-70]|uniref:efflux RND transporter periplasmic adaptor subunit n=1 Tax=unclassified Colwellia TaxID=196834 RepID=UPI0015F58A65|nr:MULTISPECIES: efflux RND transporter periplasmic adaptor subunit [unclassified Colwellia]MBA6291549.1 efflux RND transporter periplasmic adaptor subunit [Colwellia sp. MB3u-8]MBA6306088.1 efflux RND transporter periplasmic adaptor subunit [Colwellia sp. MB3u-70]
MKRIFMLGAVILLQACSEPTEVTKEAAPVVVQLTSARLTSLVNDYEFPATVSAVKSVDLKFEVSGRLILERLVEGSEVKKGQVLAKIDPKPFQRKVQESRIRHEDAQRNLKRIKDVFEKNVASQRDYDEAKSQFSITKIALTNAKQDLSYCTIRAPFDAVIGARYIENDSLIRTGDSLANLQDRSALYFTFEVPERIMTANAGNRDVKATAHIIGQEDKIFDIRYVEHKTTPDPITQTYGVTFALDGEIAKSFYPGARAIVNIKQNNSHSQTLIIPLSALVGNNDSGFSVWRFNQVQNSLTKVKVKVSKLKGEYALISLGLSRDDKVVSAAVGQMREGLIVREYKATY